MAQQESMELSSPTQNPPLENHTLHVDFSWRKFKALITSGSTFSKTSPPLYITTFKALKPDLIFTSTQDKTVFGTGTLPPISINADCTYLSQPIKLKASKRW